MPIHRSPRSRLWLAGLWIGLASPCWADDPFAGFNLPDAWEARFWADPDVKALLDLEAKALAELVPVQAGLRFCRCPGCDATEADDPLAWSPSKPGVLTCRRCGITVPNEKIPAKVENKVPAESVEVRPGTVHTYPYHVVEPERQSYPDERVYLAAKRDYEAREFLAKAVLYAAVRHHEQPPGRRDPALARLACVLLLRFAQVYPAYSVHFDQCGQTKHFQKADLPPPYRLGYRTAKWDWSGCLDVPLNLVIAYALVRDEPALADAGRLLGDPHPARTIEHDLFRASAEFVRRQPDMATEESLYAYRGMLAVGRLLGDQALIREATARINGFAEQGFFHDGLWREGDALSQRRVMALLDGWIGRLLNGTLDAVPMLSLARSAEGAVLTDPRAPEVQQAAWPAPANRTVPRHPALLGGAGVVRLAVGQGADALDLELKGLGDLGGAHFNRLALRLSVGGRSVLGDLDDLAPSPGGWERSTASHNAVVIDGLNQRESPVKAREPALGADAIFYAADPDFQVAMLSDRHAYPHSSTRYRHTVLASAGARSRYAVSIFEVHGGLQHEQLFHGPAGSPARWQTAGSLSPGPASLLPPSIHYLPTARAEEGRWFVQAFGAFTDLSHIRVNGPTHAELAGPGLPGVRLHLFDPAPFTLITGSSPMRGDAQSPAEDGRAVLVLRRRAEDGSTLKTTFVTVFEPLGPTPRLRRVGRVESPPDTVVLYIEAEEGPESLLVNLTPGVEQRVRLPDGQALATNGLAVRVSPGSLVLAGGTFAQTPGLQVRQSRAAGTIRSVSRQATAGSRGWFEAEGPVEDPSTLAGRALLIRHGDGTTRGWTLERVENTLEGRTRLYVREEPGFLLDASTQTAHDYQFPRTNHPGPHPFLISKMAR